MLDRREQDARYWREFGAWMTERRKAMLPERWTQARLADEMTATGFAVTRNWVNQVEKGEKPSPEFVAAVERHLGRVPDFETPEVPDQSDLIAALNRQTEAITALVSQVEALLAAQVPPTELAHAMGGAVGLAVREALQAGPVGAGTRQP